MLYLAYRALTVVNFVAAWGDPTATWGRQISVLTHAWAFTLAAGVLVAAIHSFRSASDRVARQQAGWICWGGGL
ncbi:MAG: hypothetical protein LC797_23510 [Chloroflexi bacterium]|nr:hypothetical protein [Chloroflexota bacterium]